MKVVLIRPPVDVLHKFSKPVECLALGYLAASLRRAGHEVEMLDGMLGDMSTEECVGGALAHDPHVIGMTNVLNHFPRSSMTLARRLREAGFDGLMVAGGHAVSFIAERILKACSAIDAVVVGEGEAAFAELVHAHADADPGRAIRGVMRRDAQGGCTGTTPSRLRDLDAIAAPARDLVPQLLRRDGLICVSTSRGCYARCSFCSVPRFYGLEAGGDHSHAGDWLARSESGVIDEIDGLVSSFGLRELLIVDDEFFGGGSQGFARASRFGDALRSLDCGVALALSCRAENVEAGVMERLARGGVAHVFIGLESGTQSSLRLYGKGHSPSQNEEAVRCVKALGMSFQPGLMIFNYKSSLAQVSENLAFLRRIGEFKPLAINTAVEPHFGAPLTTNMRRVGVLADDGIELSASYLDPQVETAKFVSSLVATAFQPFLDLIAGLQSAITYEWRRCVPGRPRAHQQLIDGFEADCNESFSGVVEWAVEEMMRRDVSRPELIADAQQRIARVESAAARKRTTLLSGLAMSGHVPRYWTQLDLIERAARQDAGAQRADAPSSLSAGA